MALLRSVTVQVRPLAVQIVKSFCGTSALFHARGAHFFQIHI
jgi:hypothetical protein